ncbi:hypothetical protein [Caballeronia glebae]|uniref:hypothetical protein n=1 Tax=Caballeronia glebae TaxID=1777143 RepID=UPI000B3515C1|nr:hypothetical protein [Caballeronia glebae]
MKPHPRPFTLRIQQNPDGRWTGTVIAADAKEVARVKGCGSPEEVEQVAMEEGFYPDHIELEGP